MHAISPNPGGECGRFPERLHGEFQRGRGRRPLSMKLCVVVLTVTVLMTTVLAQQPVPPPLQSGTARQPGGTLAPAIPAPVIPGLPPPLPLPTESSTGRGGPAPSERVHPETPLPQIAPSRSAAKRGRVALTGNLHYTDEQIRAAIADQLTALDQSGLSPALADDTAFFLGVFYRKKGFSQATVQWALAPGSLLRLVIHEGPLTQLGTVTFRGNRHIPDARLRETLSGVPKEPSPEKKAVVPYVEDDINTGVDRIRGLYRSEGFLDAVVDDPQISLSADKTRADVTVRIAEGTQYRFGKLSFEGDIVFFPQRELLKELEVFTSKPYTPLAVTNLERKVVYFYRSHGYYNAKANAESTPAEAKNGVVSVRFVVQAGDIYRFDGVTQSGLRKLRPGFLPARFKSLRGQIYNPLKLEERYRSLMGTGLFSNLKLTQIPRPNHEVELHFDVEEAKSRELGFSIGYGSLEGAIVGARYLDRDLFGFGRSLSVDAEVAQRLLRGELLYTDPWFLESDFTLRLRLYELSQDLNDYSKIETGFRAELSRKLTPHLEMTGFLLTRRVDISNLSGIAPQDIGLQQYLADSIGTSVTLDYRDSVLNPTKGLIINATADVALNVFGSSLSFVRSTVRASYYLPLGKTLLAFGARGGLIWPLSHEDEVPIDERFFNGGARSVRSYVERSLGPRDQKGNAVGGETFTNVNLEDVFPLFGQLKGAAFFDFGSVGRRLRSGFGDTGYAVGLGLRYQLPIGPIRLDYGFNPVHKSNQPTGALHFSFGFAF